MGSKRNEITQNFKKSLKAFLPEVSQNNHHIAFLHDQISREFNLVQEKIEKALAPVQETKDAVDLILHPLPLDSKKLPFLPMFTAAEDAVYRVEDDHLMSWVSKNRAPGSYFQMSKQYYSQKQSWVVKKILSVSEDFIKELVKISIETGIPLESLHNMYVLMTGINDFFQSPQNFALLEPYLYYPVPSSIPDKDRDALIFTVWNRLYNLLAECYGIVLIVGVVDLLTVLGTYQKEGLEEAQKYLIHSTVYSELERRAILIKTKDQLLAYLQEEFLAFESFFPAFGRFLEKSVEKITKRGEKRLSHPIKPMVDDILPKKGGKKWRPSSDAQDEEEGESAFPFQESEIDPDEMDGFHLSEEDGTSPKWGKKTTEDKIIFLEPDLVKGVEQKMLNGLLKNYRLTGEPDKIVHYLFKTFSNVSKTITEQIYSKNLKARYDVSLVTWKRWLKDIRDKKIILPDHPDRPAGIRSINDLFEPEIEEIKAIMKARKQHRDEKTLSQNQLIKELQKDWLLAELRKKGVRLKKYSRTSLSNKIKTLVEKMRIPFIRRGTSNRFLPGDIIEIARQVSRPIPE